MGAPKPSSTTERRRRGSPDQRGADSDTVERILDAAEHCFRAAGYSGVSIREVAERAGVSKSLVLYHFDSKDHVFAELQLRLYRRLARGVTEALADRDGLPGERARVALDALMNRPESRDDLVLHAMLGVRSLANPQAKPHIQRVRRELRQLLQGTMHELFSRDAADLPLSLDAATDLLWAALTGLSLQSLLDDSPEDLQRGFESVRTLVSNAFDRPKPRS